MTDELEAHAEIGELALGVEALGVEALASDAESMDEIAHLGRVLSDEIDRCLADSTQAVPTARYL